MPARGLLRAVAPRQGAPASKLICCGQCVIPLRHAEPPVLRQPVPEPVPEKVQTVMLDRLWPTLDGIGPSDLPATAPSRPASLQTCGVHLPRRCL